MRDERKRLAIEVTNLTTAIAAGGDIPVLVDQLKQRQRKLDTLDKQLAKPVERPDRATLRTALELRRGDWRGLLRGPHIAQARLILQHCIDLPIRVFNDPKPRWITTARESGLLVGLTHVWNGNSYVPAGSVQSVASPTGFEPVFWP
jgi:hypothetical protein